MVFNLIIWTAYGMALLIIASLYFSYLKLKIHYRGIKNFIISQVLISTSLFLVWFLNNETKFMITPLIGLLLIAGLHQFQISVLRFSKLTSKPIDLYIILPIGFIIYLYTIFIHENLTIEVVTIYSVASYVFTRSGLNLIQSKRHIKDNGIYIIAGISFCFSILYLFRVLNVITINPIHVNYDNLKDFQIITVILTFLLQILLTFNVTNIIFTRARSELDKINSGFHHSPISMIMINHHQEVVNVNSRFTNFLGYKVPQMIGKKVHELDAFKDISDNLDFINVMTSNQSFHNQEFSVTKSDGTIKRTLISISEIDYVDQQNSIIAFTDISEIHLLKEKLTDYAYYDDLTNLPNRRYLTRYFDAKTVENNRFALLCIDLDNFKSINDTHGHTIGDEVLAYLSQRLMDSMYENDFVARYAGDEFIVILDFESEYSLDHKIEKLNEAIESEIKLYNYHFKLKASIGISEFPLHGIELSDLIKQADIEMYKIKRMVKSNQ